jgi:hypothetical protein
LSGVLDDVLTQTSLSWPPPIYALPGPFVNLLCRRFCFSCADDLFLALPPCTLCVAPMADRETSTPTDEAQASGDDR